MHIPQKECAFFVHLSKLCSYFIQSCTFACKKCRNKPISRGWCSAARANSRYRFVISYSFDPAVVSTQEVIYCSECWLASANSRYRFVISYSFDPAVVSTQEVIYCSECWLASANSRYLFVISMALTSLW